MATVRAYPKHASEPIEWPLNDDVDLEELGGKLYTAHAGGEVITFPTTVGRVVIDARAYAALEVVR